MEANSFFNAVLLSLGFSVYLAGARIYKGNDTFGGWTHVVNLVKIAGTKYLLDGGFGPQESPRPLALRPGVSETQIAPAQMRVVYEPIPQNLDQSQRIWIYQHRPNEESNWAHMYCFTDMEFTPEDIFSMNFSPWLNPQTFFTHKVVAVRFTTDRTREEDPGADDETTLEGEIDGSLTLNQDVMKWRRGGKKIAEWKFRCDEERQDALKKYFGIVLSEEDREAIKGTAAEVASAGMDHD
jgi:arylamine N-acetyltransferase